MAISQRTKLNIPPFYTMEMMRYAAELEATGKQILHLEVGQSIAPTPKAVVDEAIKALQSSSLNYCSALGLLELRKAISAHYQQSYNLSVDPECIVITPGSSLGLYIALLTNFTKGDKIAIASPSYPCYRNVIRSLGLTLVEIPTYHHDDYLITPETLAKYSDIDGILIASPNNPTGSMYDEKMLKSLSIYCQNSGIKILSDELYHGITYEKKAETILKFNSEATVINGFSKYFAMTGWRVAWMIVPKEDVRLYESLLQNMILCTSSLTQIAAVKAFDAYDELNRFVAMYKNNRDVLYDSLIHAGIKNIYKPAGGFYIYVEFENLQVNTLDFCKKILFEQGVAVSPGLDFSSKAKHCCIRISFCQSPEIVELASDKLSHFIKTI
jgi:aspartate/methionine/tyrosine aminotransferase